MRLSLLLLTVLCICAATSQRPRLVRDLLPHYTFSPSTRFSDCSFTGLQPITIQWHHLSNRLPSKPSGGPYYNDDGVLILENAGPEDSGNYTCTGINVIGNTSVYTSITIEQVSSPPLSRRWFMMFVYAIVAWLVGSGLITLRFYYKHRQAVKNRPAPVDRNECFVIDHDGLMMTEQRSRSRVSGDYALYGSGYPNPAFIGPTTSSTHQAAQQQVLDYTTGDDGTITRTVLTTEKEYYYIPSSSTTGAGAAANKERRSSRRDSGIDPKLRLIEHEEETIIT